jgi:xylan 1,4-beta-xylosidase
MGSGHAALSLRADWRQHVKMAHEKLGLESVRFHGILDDDMSTSLGPGLNSYVNVDSFADFMVENNMSSVIELGFMPRWLARSRGDGFSCNHSINHYRGCSDPPSNFTQWGEVVHELVAHLVGRYGEAEIAEKWMFEVWNEPNLNGQRHPYDPPPYPGWQGGGDWWGTGAEYFQLYASAARAVKRASSRARVGGPATTGPARWVSEFQDFCSSHAVPLDFVSTHAYAGGDTNINSVDSVLTQLTASRSASRGLPHVVTEWGGSYVHGNTVIGGGGSANPDAIGKWCSQSVGCGGGGACGYDSVADLQLTSCMCCHRQRLHRHLARRF